MLVLSRLVGQKIRINDDIVIQVVEITPGKVRLGFEAPDSVSVHRQEVYDQIQKERSKHGRDVRES